MKRYFLNWWIIFNLIIVGSILCYILGVFDMTNKADVTKISFGIYAIFLIFSVRTGVYTYKFSKSRIINAKSEETQEISWFVSDILLTLGMLGTIIGYIYMIQIGFANLDPSNPASLQASLKLMAIGWGTALYTTAAGLICGLVLKLQLFNIVKQLESASCIIYTESRNSHQAGPSSDVPLRGLGV